MRRPKSDKSARFRSATFLCYGAPVQDPLQDKPFDRRLRRLRRDRAASAGESAFFLHHRAAEELLERLDLVKRPFGFALELGCGDSWLGERLGERGLKVVSIDPGADFARRARGIQCDEDRLPFADSSFDLVVSVGVLDSVNDLPGALLLARRALRPDGLFLAAFAGAGTLPRLRSALRAAEEATGEAASPRLHPQIDVRAAGDLLLRAGFALPVVDNESVKVRYSHLPALVRDLRGMAATNLLSSRARRPFGRAALASAMEDFQAYSEPDGKVSESFEILYLSGWAPSPDQPKPARRGSATASLADALHPRP